MKNFNKGNLKELRVAIGQALQTVESRFGVKFALKNISYEHTSFRTKLECYIVGADSSESVVELKARKELAGVGLLYGVDESCIGKTIVEDGESYRFIGLNKKARKFPYVFEKGGRYYKFTRRVVDKLVS